MTLSEANLQAQATWNNRACGTLSASENQAAGMLETFDRMAQRRYQRDDPWVPVVLDFPSMKGKEVLEIGHGQGCDLLHAAMAGANVHGVDLTPNHYEICKRYFAAKNLPVDLHLGNAGDLPFASESMDIVYSLGVLHHTDNTVRCISEAYRVLKPGGTFKMALYHFWSLPHLWLLLSGIRSGNLKRLGYRRLLSTVEGGADGVSIAPLVKLGDFSKVEISIHGLAYSRIPVVGRFIPPSIGRALERRCLGGEAIAAGSVEFKLCTQDNIPYGNGTFDAVITFDVLEHVDDPRISLKEIFRVLKPGGNLYAVFPVYRGEARLFGGWAEA